MTTPDEARGIHYADGGTAWGTICHPNPDRVAEFHAEWDHPATTITVDQLNRYFQKCLDDAGKPHIYVEILHPKEWERRQKK